MITGVPMSTSSAAHDQLARLKSAGHTIAALKSSRDVDRRAHGETTPPSGGRAIGANAVTQTESTERDPNPMWLARLPTGRGSLTGLSRELSTFC